MVKCQKVSEEKVKNLKDHRGKNKRSIFSVRYQSTKDSSKHLCLIFFLSIMVTFELFVIK